MIGTIIQKKRKELGMTQVQLADLLGVTAPAVNRWEKNLSFPDATLLSPLARCLKTDLNELFSFYDSLSDKDRELIVDRARTMLLTDDEQVLSYIEETIRHNLSDGLLYRDIAQLLLGMHAFQKVTAPTAYLDKIAEYYERAMQLLPEQAADISCTLIAVYAEMGNKEKAEEAWKRLPDKNYEKDWSHAEMLYQLKDYSTAIPEFKQIVLRKVVELSQKLLLLCDAMYLYGDEKNAMIAENLDVELRQLFGLWRGFDVINRITSAIETGAPGAKEINLSEFLVDDYANDTFTASPLFDGVVLGGKSKEESTTADLMADILSALKKFPANKNP